MRGSILLSTNRKTIQSQIVRHPLVAFVVLAYTISWLLMWRLDMGAVNGFSIIGGAGPAFSGKNAGDCSESYGLGTFAC